MIHNVVLIVLLGLTGGCQFYQNVVMDEDGHFFPWHAHRDNPEHQKKWNEDRVEWEIKDAGRRYETGMIDRYQYNQVRKRHGLQPIPRISKLRIYPSLR